VPFAAAVEGQSQPSPEQPALIGQNRL